jgi:hypothetical protein
VPGDVRIEIRGARELAGDFDRAARTIPPEVRRLEIGAAYLVVPIAKGLAPVGETGRLRAAIQVAGRQGNAIQFGGTQAPYGPVINFGGTLPRHGTSQRTRVQSQEHIYTAIEIAEFALDQHFERGIIEIVDREIGGRRGRRALAGAGSARGITGR